MRFSYTFRHMESSPALIEHAESKISEKVLKFVTKPIEAHVTFSVDKLMHKVHCDVLAGDGFNIHADHQSEDMYASIDQMLDKLEIQLRKQKEKLKDHHKGPSPIKTREMSEEYLLDEHEQNSGSAIDASEILRRDNKK